MRKCAFGIFEIGSFRVLHEVSIRCVDRARIYDLRHAGFQSRWLKFVQYQPNCQIICLLAPLTLKPTGIDFSLNCLTCYAFHQSLPIRRSLVMCTDVHKWSLTSLRKQELNRLKSFPLKGIRWCTGRKWFRRMCRLFWFMATTMCNPLTHSSSGIRPLLSR